MKLNRRDIRRLINEVLNEEDNSMSMDSQNRELEAAMYEYLARFAQAPEDEELLNSEYFGHRSNPETQEDTQAMSILNNTGTDLGLKLDSPASPGRDDRDVKYVFCFFHMGRFVKPFFGTRDISHIQKMIDYAKRTTGNEDAEIKIGFTSNSRRYDDKRNDNSVITVNRMS